MVSNKLDRCGVRSTAGNFRSRLAALSAAIVLALTGCTSSTLVTMTRARGVHGSLAPRAKLRVTNQGDSSVWMSFAGRSTPLEIPAGAAHWARYEEGLEFDILAPDGDVTVVLESTQPLVVDSR